MCDVTEPDVDADAAPEPVDTAPPAPLPTPPPPPPQPPPPLLERATARGDDGPITVARGEEGPPRLPEEGDALGLYESTLHCIAFAFRAGLWLDCGWIVAVCQFSVQSDVGGVVFLALLSSLLSLFMMMMMMLSDGRVGRTGRCGGQVGAEGQCK